MFDRTVRKNGQRRYRSLSTSRRPSPPEIHCSTADPVPYQPGSITRDWLHASTHGIARRSEMDVVCLRHVGRLPMLSAPISLTGVDAMKYSTNPGVSWTNSAYARGAGAR